jgi:hypothetical protein
MAVFWPSKKFTDKDLIPGGAAGVDSGADAAILSAQLDVMKDTVEDDPAALAAIEAARALIPQLAMSKTAQDQFVAKLASAVPPVHGERDEGLDDARDALSGPDPVRGRDVLGRLSDPIVLDTPDDAQGGAATFDPGAPGAPDQVTAAGLFGLSGGILSGASMLANLFTYGTMKDRAGVVGRGGVVKTLAAIAAARPAIKIHLIGHSFGGRLVTAAANALAAGSAVESMLLCEAAYSHNGLAQRWDGTNDGSFRGVVAQRKVRRAIGITHSAHDWPVGIAYPLASRILNQVAQAFGGPDDKFGGMGRNGAQHTPESRDDVLMPVGHAYAPLDGTTFIRNLSGDGTAAGSVTISGHGDIAKPEIAYAWLTDVK